MAEEAAWIRQQRKAFMGWCNGHLIDRNLSIKSFETDLADGVILWNLMEIISAKKLPRLETPKTKFQKVGNLNIVFKFLEQEKLRLVNIGSEDIYNGQSKLILGFIWTLILRWQIQKGSFESGAAAKQELLDWVNRTLAPQNIHVKDFKGSWSDGAALVGLVNALRPGALPRTGDPIPDMNNAFDKGEELLRIPKLLDAELVNKEPDDLSIMTYVSYYRAKQQEEEKKAGLAVDAKKSKLEGKSHFKEEEPVIVKLTARTASGEPVSGVDLDSLMDLGVLDHNGVPAGSLKAHEKENGVFELEFTPSKDDPIRRSQLLQSGIGHSPLSDAPSHPEKKKGKFRIVAKAPKGQGEDVHGSPLEIKVGEVPNSGKSYAVGPGIMKPQAGAPNPVTVHTVKDDGKKLEEGGAEVVAIVDGADGKHTVPVKDNGDGTYSFDVTPLKEGPLVVSINVDGEPIKDSPFHVEAKDLSETELSGPGLKHAYLQADAVFHVERKGVQAGTKDALEVTVEGPSGPIEPEVVQTDDKGIAFDVKYRPTELGKHKVSVTYATKPANHSPFQVEVTTPFDANKTTAEGPGLEKPLNGEPTHFNVHLKDQEGNPITQGTYDVDVALHGPGNIEPKIENKGDGTYKVDYTPEHPGKYTIDVKVDGQPIKDSPFHVEIFPTADADKTKLEGKSHYDEDEPIVFKVSPKNGAGEPIFNADIPNVLDFEVTDRNGEPAGELEFSDNKDGTYNAQLPKKGKGKYRIRAKPKNKDEDVDGSPLKFSVGDVADGKQSYADGPGLDEPQINGASPVVVHAVNEDGKPAKEGGAEVKATIDGPEGKQEVPVKDNGDGTYTFDVNPTKEGPLTIDVTVDGEPIKNSPFHVEAKDHTTVHASGEGIKHAYLNTDNTFDVEIKEAFSATKEDVQVKVDGPNGAESNVHVDQTDDKGLKYAVKYHPANLGKHTIAVSALGHEAEHSPFTVDVRNPFDASKSTASGPGLEAPVEDRPTEFTVQIRDHEGNPLKNGGYDVTADFSGPAEIKPTITDNNDGTYTVVYLPSIPGDYKVEVKVDDKPVQGSPFNVDVQCSADPSKTTAEGEGTKHAKEDEPTKFTIQARDKDGKPMKVGGNDFKIESNLPVDATVKDNGDGTYDVEYTPRDSGKLELAVKLDDKNIDGAPFEVEVAPLIVGHAKGHGLKKASTTKKNYFEVALKTKKGKDYPVSDEVKLEATVSGPQGNVPVEVTPKKHHYVVAYQPEQPGEHTVEVKVNGNASEGSPFTVNCVEGPDRSKLLAEGGGLKKALTTKPAKFDIIAKDKNGNPVDDEDFTVEFFKVPESGEPEKVDVPVTAGESKKGKYPFEYKLKAAGKYQLDIKYGDEHIPNSPFEVTCKVGASKDKTTADKWSFTITAITDDGEIAQDDAEDFQVVFEGPAPIEPKIKYKGKGKYFVSYKPKEAGEYKIHVTLNGDPVRGSPFTQNY